MEAVEHVRIVLPVLFVIPAVGKAFTVNVARLVAVLPLVTAIVPVVPLATTAVI
jgi:uncharacterized membrane protein